MTKLFRKILFKISNLDLKNVRNEFRLGKDDQFGRMGKELSEKTFIGGPVDKFSIVGRLYLITLLKLGITPDSKILDVGSGALRGGYWLIHFLKPGGYFGIEPNTRMLESGLQTLFDEEILKYKKPRFDNNSEFDFSVFSKKFDYVVARSIWTHCSKDQIEIMLDQFIKYTGAGGVFLTSYIRPVMGFTDYKGKKWIGKSDKETKAGVIHHKFSWIREQCQKRNLKVEELTFDYIGQVWLYITKGLKDINS